MKIDSVTAAIGMSMLVSSEFGLDLLSSVFNSSYEKKLSTGQLEIKKELFKAREYLMVNPRSERAFGAACAFNSAAMWMDIITPKQSRENLDAFIGAHYYGVVA